MTKYIVFADHEIGYNLLQDLLRNSNSTIEYIITTKSNENSWWPSISSLSIPSNVKLRIYEDGIDDLNFEGVDYVLLLSWKYILKKDLLSRIRAPVINLHYSLLPDFRGSYPVNWAILSGENETGVTFHLVNEDIDSGSIVLQEKLLIEKVDTTRSLQLKLDLLARNMFSDLILNINSLNIINKKKVNSVVNTKVGFKNRMTISLNENYSGEEFFNIIRSAHFPYNPPEIKFIDSKGDVVFSFTVNSKD